MTATTCASCTHCTCSDGCALCLLYRPAGEGTHRLNGSVLEDECVCDLPKHCPACSFCVCDQPATVDDLAADVRLLPGVTDVRIRRHVDLPRTHVARFWDVSRDERIVISVDHAGQPPATITVRVSDKDLAFQSMLAMPRDWVDFVHKWKIAYNNDPEHLVSDYDPRKNRALDVEHLAMAYAEHFYHTDGGFPGPDLDSAVIHATRARMIMAIMLADATGFVPFSLIFRFPCLYRGSFHLHRVSPIRNPEAPFVLDSAHCDECSDPLWLSTSLAEELIGVPGTALASEEPFNPQDVVALLPDSVLDLAADHDLSLWMLALVVGTVSLHNSNPDVGMPVEMAQALIAMLNSARGVVVESADEDIVTYINRMWSRLRTTVCDLSALLHAQAHVGDTEAQQAVREGWPHLQEQATGTIEMWSELAQQGSLDLIAVTTTPPSSTATAQESSSNVSEALADAEPDEEDSYEDEPDGSPPSRFLREVHRTVITSVLLRLELAAAKAASTEPVASDPQDLADLKRRKTAAQARVRQQRAFDAKQQAVLDAADRLRVHIVNA